MRNSVGSALWPNSDCALHYSCVMGSCVSGSKGTVVADTGAGVNTVQKPGSGE